MLRGDPPNGSVPSLVVLLEPVLNSLVLGVGIPARYSTRVAAELLFGDQAPRQPYARYPCWGEWEHLGQLARSGLWRAAGRTEWRDVS